MGKTKKYITGTLRYKIKGVLHRTKRTVKPIRCGKRTIHKDDRGKLWVKIRKKWWRFPNEVEY